jgi:hypothetical protein
MNTPLAIMDLMVGLGIIDTITHLVAQDMLIETPNLQVGPFDQSYKSCT